MNPEQTAADSNQPFPFKFTITRDYGRGHRSYGLHDYGYG